MGTVRDAPGEMETYSQSTHPAVDVIGTTEGGAEPLPKELTDSEERGEKPSNPASRLRLRAPFWKEHASPSFRADATALMTGRSSIT